MLTLLACGFEHIARELGMCAVISVPQKVSLHPLCHLCPQCHHCLVDTMHVR